MDIFSVFTMAGGLAMFLYGMDTMGDGLVKISGGKLEQILEKLTSKKITAVLFGAFVTAVIQSSSATTVMVVGFVNSGIMKLSQAVGIIMGANIGTTVTSWILSLTGIQGDNFFIQLLKPTTFSPVLAVIGIILIMSAKNSDKKKDIGTIMIGFAILMFGMETMSSTVSPLADNPHFTSLMTKFTNPFLGMLAGALLTAIIQSSSASVGILQALCATGAVSLGAAIPIIMGQNIGTCVTAIISSIGANKNAKRTAMIHLYFNLIGTLAFMILLYASNAFIHYSFLSKMASVSDIAIVHSLFNIGCCIALFPFSNVLVKLATITIRDKDDNVKEETPAIQLDERFLENPSFAIELCKNTAVKMAKDSKFTVMLSTDIIEMYEQEKVNSIFKLEENTDNYEDVLGTYLVKLSSCDLSIKDSRSLTVLLHCITDFEKIADYSVRICNARQQMNEKDVHFTEQGKKELLVLSGLVNDVVDKTLNVFKNSDLEGARLIEPVEEVVDTMSSELKQRHIKRLRHNECSFETGIYLEDIIIAYKRISDHCSNIAASMIKISEDGYDIHTYLNQTLDKNSEEYKRAYEEALDKFVLPVEGE